MTSSTPQGSATGSGGRPIGPYSPVRRAGPWLVCSGQIGAVNGALVDGGVQAQTRHALANIAALLEAEGASLASVVKTTVFLVHISDYGLVNEAYAEAFAGTGPALPARSAVAVSALPAGALVEIEAWSYLEAS